MQNIKDLVTHITASLVHAIAPRAVRERAPALWFLWFWLPRARARLLALVARHEAGRPLAPRPRAPRPRTPRPPRDPARRLPTRRGWLAREMGFHCYQTNLCIAPLQALVASPECRALLAAAPQAGRILRPLCRALNVPLPEHLRLPPRPRRPKPPPAPKPPREGSRAWYALLNTNPDGTAKTWPDCYGPRRWAQKRPA